MPEERDELQRLRARLEASEAKISRLEAEKFSLELTADGLVCRMKELEGELQRAQIDILTGLHNSNTFHAGLELYEMDPNTSIVIFDLLNLKLVNDLISHHAGDRMLKRVGDVILDVAAEHDLPARSVTRSGGDEFGLFVPRGMGWGFVQAVQLRFEGDPPLRCHYGEFHCRPIGGASDARTRHEKDAPAGHKYQRADTAMEQQKLKYIRRERAAGRLIARDMGREA